MTAVLPDLHTIARALGGEVSTGQVSAPGPGHDPRDRSMRVRFDPRAPDGFVVTSFSTDDWRDCRDYVKVRLGRPAWQATPKDDPFGRLIARAPPLDPPAIDAKRIARARALWHEARDPRGTIVEHYLESRDLALEEEVALAVLRFHPACPWREGEAVNLVPAMIAAMREVDSNAITAVHRTRLTPEGAKVNRRMLGPAGGAAVKLDADEAVTHGLAIGEGIETVLAARQLGFRPAWAMCSAGGVAALPVLAGVEALTLLAENDAVNGQAVQACATRWHRAEREVTVVTPNLGNDLNDAIRGAA